MPKVIAVVLVMGVFLVGAMTAPKIDDLTYTDEWCERNCASCHGSY